MSVFSNKFIEIKIEFSISLCVCFVCMYICVRMWFEKLIVKILWKSLDSVAIKKELEKERTSYNLP